MYLATLFISGISFSGRDASRRTSAWQTCRRTTESSSDARLKRHAMNVSMCAKSAWQPMGTKYERQAIACARIFEDGCSERTRNLGIMKSNGIVPLISTSSFRG